ncbi:hypothetical protein [Paraglaciecola sp. L3A3]|uniref:hypothetical protein n=1 Tax=Paraglaciecola sp. L3A3 TaxID=2686358 RepID=UPI00131AA49C|nr:hypothetical protein [Paraglaciecola sp. L3A3]
MNNIKQLKNISINIYGCLILSVFYSLPSCADMVLLGDNAPYANVNDGDFTAVWATWRAAKQSPFWTTRAATTKDKLGLASGNQTGGLMGLHLGNLYSSYAVGIAESKVLNTHPDYQQLSAGDVIEWSFGADLEYISDGSLSLNLVFGSNERPLAEKVTLIGSDKKLEHFSGQYIVTKKDVKDGLPFVRAIFYSSRGIKVYLNYVNIRVKAAQKSGPRLTGKALDNGVALNWQANPLRQDKVFYIYRGQQRKKTIVYEQIAESKNNSFTDTKLIHGIAYTYVVTSTDNQNISGSNQLVFNVKDTVAPKAPTKLKVVPLDSEIQISWAKNDEDDIASYSLYRIDPSNKDMQQIASGLNKPKFVDFTPIKSVQNQYIVYANDYSGNISQPSKAISGQAKMVNGASFNDLIKPMPIHNTLRSDLWGADAVLPRDPDNGIEDADWSYWGGRPVAGKDGKYHMQVTRWPANATKGHWEWPHSTVAYALADKPTGPYKVKKATSYDYMQGLGHNPDIVLLNDGRYMLYSLINWQPMLLVAATMAGPWQHLGVMEVDTTGADEKPAAFYRFERNLSGVQLEDGRFLFVSKAGAMMISKGSEPLGPYRVLTSPLQHNKIIPKAYRHSNYEDPVLWKDEVQYHMIINAFLDYRAIYLRSADGIHWKFNPGTAYTPNSTVYEDGTRTYWYKLERPHVLTDQYGRATHLSLAAIDVPKADDLAKDKHSSKNIILPLIVHRRLTILNEQTIDNSTQVIHVLIRSEADFDAHQDIDFNSLRFGAPEEVDYGRGSKVLRTSKHGSDLVIEFDANSHGFTADNFAGKMLGKTTNGELLIGFAKINNK